MNNEFAAGEAAYVAENCVDCVWAVWQGSSSGGHAQQFASLGAYYNWVTDLEGGLPILQNYQVYQAYLEDCAHATYSCGGGDQLVARIQGLTSNYRLAGNPLNVSSLKGMVRDPNLFSFWEHGGSSAYSWDILDPWHVAGYGKGQDVESHQDLFNGVLAFPAHFLFDFVPSLFINPKPGVQGPAYTCWYGEGCAPK